MLGNQEIKSRYEDTLQAPHNKQKFQQSTFTEILKQSIKSFTKWPAKKQFLAVGAIGGIFFTILPALSIVLPFATLGTVVAFTLYFAVQTIFYTAKGIKWPVEKVIEGAGYSVTKVKEGAEYSIKQINKGANYLGQRATDGLNYTTDSLKRGTGNVLYSMADRLHSASGGTNYLEKMKEFTIAQRDLSKVIKEEFKEVCTNKQNSSNLIEKILSGIEAKIDLKIKEEESLDWIEHTDRWIEQKKFINGLNARKLRTLLTQRVLPKDSYFIDSIFSEHYSEIREVIADYKESDLLANSMGMFDKEKTKRYKVLSRDLSHIFSSKEREVHNSTSSPSSNGSIKVNTPTVLFESSPLPSVQSKEKVMSGSLIDEYFKELERRKCTLIPEPMSESNSLNELTDINDRSLSVSEGSFCSFDSGNESNTRTSTEADNKKSFPTFKPASSIDVHAVTQQRNMYKSK